MIELQRGEITLLQFFVLAGTGAGEYLLEERARILETQGFIRTTECCIRQKQILLENPNPIHSHNVKAY